MVSGGNVVSGDDVVSVVTGGRVGIVVGIAVVVGGPVPQFQLSHVINEPSG